MDCYAPGLLLSKACIGMLRWTWRDLFSSKEKMNGDNEMFEMPPQPGTKKLSISISPSWPEYDEPIANFDFYKGEDSSWKVYWELSSM